MDKSWLQKLQEADEHVKNIYVLAGSLVVMSLIVFVWLTWFNNVPSLASAGENSATVTANSSGFSFFESLKAMGASVGEYLGGLLGTSKEYIIRPGQ